MSITLDELESLENQTTAIQVINSNFEELVEAIEALQETRTTALDMNGYPICNLPAPTSATNPVRLADMSGFTIDEAAVLPPLEGNEGKFLSTDGINFVFNEASLDDYLSIENNLDDLDDVAAARSNLGLGSAALLTEDVLARPAENNVWSGNQTFNGATILGGTVNHTLTSTPTVLTATSIGFRGIPVQTVNASQTFALTDAGNMYRQTSSTNRTYTIPTNTAVAFPVGTVIMIRNTGTGTVTITPAGGVSLRQAGASGSGSVSMAQWGIASLTKEATNDWLITGSGLS